MLYDVLLGAFRMPHVACSRDKERLGQPRASSSQTEGVCCEM